MKCPYCNGQVIYLQDGEEYVCTQCGTVVDTVYIPSVSMIRSSSTSTSRYICFQDLSKEVKDETIRSSSFYRKLELVDRMLRSSSQTKQKVIMCMRSLGRKLGIDESHLRVAEEVFHRIVKACKNTSYSNVSITYFKIAASALLYTVLIHMLPVNPKDIIEVFRESGHRVSYSDVVKILALLNRGFAYDVSSRVMTYVRYVINKLELDDRVKMRLLRECVRALSTIRRRRRLVQGKCPRTVAGALVLISSKSLGLNLDVMRLCNLLSVSALTLKDYVRVVEQALAK